MEKDENRQTSVLKPTFLETIEKNYNGMVETYRELQNKVTDFAERILVAEFQLKNVRAETKVLQEGNRDLEYSVRSLRQKHERNDGLVTELRKELTPLRKQLEECHQTTQELRTGLALAAHELAIVCMHSVQPCTLCVLKFLEQDDQRQKSSQQPPEAAESSDGANKRLKRDQDSPQRKFDEMHDSDPENSSGEERQQQIGNLEVAQQVGVEVLQQVSTRTLSVSAGPSSPEELHEEGPGNSSEEQENDDAVGEEVDVDIPQVVVPLSEEIPVSEHDHELFGSSPDPSAPD